MGVGEIRASNYQSIEMMNWAMMSCESEDASAIINVKNGLVPHPLH
jgi:hypothetical protein